MKSAPGGLHEFLTGPRMSAAGVRPEPAKMVFRCRSLLEQHASVRTEEHDGKRTVEKAGACVGLKLLGRADLLIQFVYENDLFHN